MTDAKAIGDSMNDNVTGDRPWLVEFFREDGALLHNAVAPTRGDMAMTMADQFTRVCWEVPGRIKVRLSDFSGEVFEGDAALERLGIPQMQRLGAAASKLWNERAERPE